MTTDRTAAPARNTAPAQLGPRALRRTATQQSPPPTCSRRCSARSRRAPTTRAAPRPLRDRARPPRRAPKPKDAAEGRRQAEAGRRRRSGRRGDRDRGRAQARASGHPRALRAAAGEPAPGRRPSRRRPPPPRQPAVPATGAGAGPGVAAVRRDPALQGLPAQLPGSPAPAMPADPGHRPPTAASAAATAASRCRCSPA